MFAASTPTPACAAVSPTQHGAARAALTAAADEHPQSGSASVSEFFDEHRHHRFEELYLLGALLAQSHQGRVHLCTALQGPTSGQTAVAKLMPVTEDAVRSSNWAFQNERAVARLARARRRPVTKHVALIEAWFAGSPENTAAVDKWETEVLTANNSRYGLATIQPLLGGRDLGVNIGGRGTGLVDGGAGSVAAQITNYQQLARLAFGLLKGVGYLHSLGVAHHDLHAANVMSSGDLGVEGNYLSVIDMGCASAGFNATGGWADSWRTLGVSLCPFP